MCDLSHPKSRGAAPSSQTQSIPLIAVRPIAPVSVDPGAGVFRSLPVSRVQIAHLGWVPRVLAGPKRSLPLPLPARQLRAVKISVAQILNRLRMSLDDYLAVHDVRHRLRGPLVNVNRRTDLKSVPKGPRM